MSQIIFLHGASSSGKSTIARALQARIELPFWHVSVDHLKDSGILPIGRYRSGEFSWPSSRAAIFNGFHRSLQRYADAGNNLILEHILDTEGWVDDLKTLFADHDVLFVAVHCSIPLLSEREATRGDRETGSAERDQKIIHAGRTYDLELDSEDGVDANVDAILTAWRRPERRSDFSDGTC